MADNDSNTENTMSANEAFLASLGIQHGQLQETPPYDEVDDTKTAAKTYSPTQFKQWFLTRRPEIARQQQIVYDPEDPLHRKRHRAEVDTAVPKIDALGQGFDTTSIISSLTNLLTPTVSEKYAETNKRNQMTALAAMTAHDTSASFLTILTMRWTKAPQAGTENPLENLPNLIASHLQFHSAEHYTRAAAGDKAVQRLLKAKADLINTIERDYDKIAHDNDLARLIALENPNIKTRDWTVNFNLWFKINKEIVTFFAKAKLPATSYDAVVSCVDRICAQPQGQLNQWEDRFWLEIATLVHKEMDKEGPPALAKAAATISDVMRGNYTPKVANKAAPKKGNPTTPKGRKR